MEYNVIATDLDGTLLTSNSSDCIVNYHLWNLRNLLVHCFN